MIVLTPIIGGISFLYDMPKYYIVSGQLKYIVDCNDPESAIMSGIHYAKEQGIDLGIKICVSEKGFSDSEKCYDTEKYNKKGI